MSRRTALESARRAYRLAVLKAWGQEALESLLLLGVVASPVIVFGALFGPDSTIFGMGSFLCVVLLVSLVGRFEARAKHRRQAVRMAKEQLWQELDAIREMELEGANAMARVDAHIIKRGDPFWDLFSDDGK